MSKALLPLARRSLARNAVRRSAVNAHGGRTLMTLPAFSLEGKTCVVTGAARGLEGGKASIEHITEHISSQPTTRDYKPELRAYACDVTSEQQVQDTWKAVVQDFGRVDVVVTAAGIVENFEAENYAYDRWKKMMDINLNGSFLFAKEAGRHWIEQSIKGNLILVSSMSASICVRPQKQAAYNASKGAVSLLGRSLATEWGPKGIRVNNLCPGYMKTDLIIDLLEKEGKHIEEGWVKDVPMGRLAHPSELQGTIVWMASDASSYLHGSDIVVDGGYCCW
ncbi:short-chain dehydrogenase/reductase-like protein SDR [Mollisia scopiformis]|uniref:Short-chain dehydrogenase/reductase-like protein SDR n=1 Tax=Mollisia scopiformis TaxID=149040 RepID=A0A132B4U0_MOLSC|nr:short-chain dehydrogenase/reductase-like protein SDR [Mollisia scopiformis]KUJ07263.1 short-chain dehydrogenase/reductase-like protein SDR [Mollisia scopiformis]